MSEQSYLSEYDLREKTIHIQKNKVIQVRRRQIRADIIYANRDKWAQWGVSASANVLLIPYPGNVLLDCSFAYF